MFGKKTNIDEIGHFTPRAQQVLALARLEADRLNHNFVGTEHLLLGLIKLGQGVAVNVLVGRLGIDLGTVRKEIELQVGQGSPEKSAGPPPYTPRVKKVITLADEERQKLNHNYLGTEHILLGLLLEGDGVAARILKNLDVEIERARQEILRELNPNLSPESDHNTKSSTPKKTTTMPSPDLIDTGKRYDVYCTERNQEVVVYRNALFRGVKMLFQTRQYDFMSEFVELEQVDGQTIFLARTTIIKFCEHRPAPDANLSDMFGPHRSD